MKKAHSVEAILKLGYCRKTNRNVENVEDKEWLLFSYGPFILLVTKI